MKHAEYFYLTKFHLNLESEIMNTTVKGYWNVKKEKLKQKYPDIKEKDLRYNEGKEKVMLEIIGYKLGKTEQELLNIIVNL